MAKFKTIITTVGAAKIAAVLAGTGTITLNKNAKMAIGDGNGTLPTPVPSQTALVHEVYRAPLNNATIDDRDPKNIVAELVIPPETGGFWMREMALYDAAGTLLAIGNMAETYKPSLSEGAGRKLVIRMVIAVSDVSAVTITMDSSTVMATNEYVDKKIDEHEKSRKHPDATLTAKGFTQLNSATDSVSETQAATPKAVKTVMDETKTKAPIASPVLTGIPTAPTAAAGTSTKQLANTEFVRQAISALINSSPGLLDTLGELAAALGNDANFATTMANALAGKVPNTRKVNGHALSGDFDVTAQDIFSSFVILGDNVDLNTLTTPGIYVVPNNAQAASGTNYPEPYAGSIVVYPSAGVTQVYRVYGGSRTHSRSQHAGVWSERWAKAYDSENPPPSGTTAQKGMVQLSSDTNSTSETLAATPKAVKTAYDLAAAKYTALDATTARKGIVQLNSATDSTSETQAATPKAVKTVMDEAKTKAPIANPVFTGTPTAPTAAAGTSTKQLANTEYVRTAIAALVASSPSTLDTLNELAAALGNDPNFAATMAAALGAKVPNTRKVNGRPLTNDVDVTAQDIFANPVILGDGVNLKTLTTPGLYVVPNNSQAASGSNYPEPQAGTILVYPSAGGVKQIYMVYSGGKTYSHGLYSGAWSEWAENYDSLNPVPDATTGRKGVVQLANGPGSSSTLVMTQTAVTALNNTNIGKSQAVTDVTASRALGVTYTNTTGSPIAVSVAVTGGLALTLTATVSGVRFGYDSSTAERVAGNGVFFIVPAGATYSVVAAQSPGVLLFWTELR